MFIHVAYAVSLLAAVSVFGVWNTLLGSEKIPPPQEILFEMLQLEETSPLFVLKYHFFLTLS